jgi:hypothetical protein
MKTHNIKVLDEWKEDGRELAQYLSTITRQAQKSLSRSAIS